MRALLPLVATLVITSPALAQSPLDRIFETGSDCYLRSYSRDHLAKHPDQLVTEIAIGPTASVGLGDRYFPVTVAISRRGDNERYFGIAFCENSGGDVACTMEGDAGAFTLSVAQKGAVLLTVSRRGMGFEGSRDYVELSGTSGDDRSFLMPFEGRRACP